MSFETDMVAYLEDDLDFDAVIGNRIYPIILPQGPDLPALVYKRVSAPRQGRGHNTKGLSKIRIEFKCWSTDYLTAQSLGGLVKSKFENFQGSFNGRRIHSAELAHDRDDREPDTDRWYRLVDIIFTCHE